MLEPLFESAVLSISYLGLPNLLLQLKHLHSLTALASWRYVCYKYRGCNTSLCDVNSFQGQAFLLLGCLLLINKFSLFQVGAH